MILLAISTYLIVFNHDHLVQSGRSRYRIVQCRILKHVKKELKTDSWKQRAMDFERFEPDRRDVKPSEWYILLATARLAYKYSVASVRRHAIDMPDIQSDAGSTPPLDHISLPDANLRTMNWFCRSFIRRKSKKCHQTYITN